MQLNFAQRVLWLSLVCLQLPLSVRTWDVDFNINFLCQCGKIIKMEGIIWYVSERLETTNSAGVQQLIITVDECLNLPQVIMTNRTDIRFMRTNIMKQSIYVVLCTASDDPILDVHDRTLIGRHEFFGLLIMVNMVDDFQIVEKLLLRLFKHNFQRALLYYYSSNRTNELFRYQSYPQFKYINSTNFLKIAKKLIRRHFVDGMNLEGYKIYTTLGQSLPHVFSYKNNSTKQTVWQGPSYNLLELYTEYYNASLVGYEMPKDHLGGNVVDMKLALDLIRRKKVTIVAEAYALFKHDDEVSKTYPIMVVRWCIMVPIWNSVSTMYYPLQPFDEPVWFGIIFTFVVLLLIRCFRVLECFCLSIGLPTPSTIAAPSVIYFFSFTCIFFYGFFLTANYTSLLGSILTVTLFQEQINTMDDLITANISVMIIDYELEFLRSEGDELPANFSRLLLPVDPATFTQHQVQFNTSFAYFITEEKWRFLSLQQKYLKQPLFKLSDICFGSYHLAFPLQMDSILRRNFLYYVLRLYSSGLLSHFVSLSFDCAVNAGLVQRMIDYPEFIAVGMQQLFVIFSMLLVMLSASFLTFVVEQVIYSVSRRRRNEVQ